MGIAITMRKPRILLSLLAILGACAISPPAYKAYLGDVRDDMQLSTLDGTRYLRIDTINRYVDAVRFLSVDGIQIENSGNYRAIQIAPGFHDVTVYFEWDLGSARGLAPALVNYAAQSETMSRTLHFNARAGELYRVRAEPVFKDKFEDITTLSHVDFWIEDRQDNQIVTREQGSYVPSR
ncbi:MAG: hypothetical protein MK319_08975 [Pseudomonadales bacterium]|nr:hypothetical protein [Pseudomonadales bacterium]